MMLLFLVYRCVVDSSRNLNVFGRKFALVILRDVCNRLCNTPAPLQRRCALRRRRRAASPVAVRTNPVLFRLFLFHCLSATLNSSLSLCFVRLTLVGGGAATANVIEDEEGQLVPKI
jgi:hypothetical protein